VPLWFGNQHASAQENPVYGTSRALTHLSRVPQADDTMMARTVAWLLSVQNGDGGWGGSSGIVSSIEETALAVDALAEMLLHERVNTATLSREAMDSAVNRGAVWLIANTAEGRSVPASPIGLYFARLWYAEELYPLTFALSALGKVQKRRDHLAR
jgi:squalene-hopene/tetraprenyl-beta-curcumene cyclase